MQQISVQKEFKKKFPSNIFPSLASYILN